MPDTYTHIVVGAGSAGCVVASRLSENERFDVLLIEAGPDYGLTEKVPSSVANSRRVPMRGQSEKYDASIDWNLKVKMPDSSLMQLPQAKLMGGGSSINGGTALRSTEADSREWVELGNDAWDFGSVYSVYQSLEDDGLRDTHGPHPIVRTSEEETGRIQKAFLDGAAEVGFRRVHDLNETGAEGAGPSPVCRRGNDRVSSANTFIDPVRNRRNLRVLSGSLVDRVTFEDSQATGVLLSTKQHIRASQEVVLCSGAIFSPAILQRSGIGPSQLLKALGIAQVVDLPVGLSAFDHPCIPIVAKPRENSYKADDYSLQHQARWSSSLRPGYIDLQLVCFSYLFAEAPDPRVQQQRSLAGVSSGHVAGIGCNVNKPMSFGTIKIESQNSIDLPLIVPNYLQSALDRQCAREVVRTAYEIITSPSMQEVLGPPLVLTSAIVNSDSQLDEYILSHVTSTYHFCCTNRMANRENGGVVDQSGRVYGIQGLRVCDASILPTVPAANTMWSTMMVAERIGTSMRDGKDVVRRSMAKL